MTGEQVGWLVLLAPLALIKVLIFAGMPPIFVLISVPVRSAILSAAFVLIAIVVQVVTWPDEPKCSRFAEVCTDPYSTYRLVIAACWLVFGITPVVLAANSVRRKVSDSFENDPYVKAVRHHNEQRRTKD